MIAMIKGTPSGVNVITARTVYGGAGGSSLGGIAAGLAPGSAQTDGVSESGVIGADGQTTPASTASAVSTLAGQGLFGKPTTWWLVLVAVVLGVMWIAKRYGGGEGGATFAAIKPSFFNMFAITGNAVIGIVLLKILFNKIQVPGLTPLINAV